MSNILNTESQTQIKKIRVDDIHADYEFNCREIITDYSVTEIKESIRINGLLQPLVVKHLSEPDKMAWGTDRNYFLVAGFRRYKAISLLEMVEVDCNILYKDMTEVDMLCLNLMENEQRAALSLLEGAKVVGKLYLKGLTRDQICHKIGMKTGWVQTRLYVFRMPEHIQKAADAGLLTMQQIRDIHSVLVRDGEVACIAYANELIKHKKEKGETLIVKPMTRSTSNDLSKPKRRSNTEIKALADHWYENFVNYGVAPGLPASFLAWVAGDISSNELYKRLDEFAIENNIDYIVPDKELTGRIFGGY